LGDSETSTGTGLLGCPGHIGRKVGVRSSLEKGGFLGTSAARPAPGAASLDHAP
jgi:hypothetical protein